MNLVVVGVVVIVVVVVVVVVGCCRCGRCGRRCRPKWPPKSHCGNLTTEVSTAAEAAWTARALVCPFVAVGGLTPSRAICRIEPV